MGLESVVRRPCQGRPPAPPGSSAPSPPESSCAVARLKLFLRVAESTETVVRRPRQGRPRQGRPPSPPGSPAKLFLPSLPGSPAKLFLQVPARVPCPPGSPQRGLAVSRVVRRPRQGHPPSPPGSSSAVPTKTLSVVELFLRMVWSRPCRSSAVAVRVAHQAPLVSEMAGMADDPGGDGGTTLESRSAVPTRVVRHPRQGRPPSSFCEC